MRVLDLFSGIGGFSLGLERAGMKTVAFCEIDPFCRKVLRKHWPDVPIFEDVRTLTAGDIPGPVNVISGGFPCQPYSIAGKRMGNEDARALWPEYRRLIEELGPDWVVGENVVGIVELALDGVLADLEGLGYAARTFDIPSCVTGLPTMERHIWIIAQANRIGSEGGERQALQNQPALTWQLPGSDKGIGDRWAIPSARVCRGGEGIPHRMDRIRALGNAVPPQIPEIIGRAILCASSAP